MKVVVYILDEPTSVHRWSKKVITLNTLNDLEKLVGYCGEWLYAEAYDFTGNESAELHEIVNHYIQQYNKTVKDTVDRLFRMISILIKREV